VSSSATTTTTTILIFICRYELLEVLGSGAFGVVRKCRNRETGELAACKTIDKARVENLQNLTREIEMLKEVHHPHIVELYDVYEDAVSLHLVTELCSGGELYDKVIEKAESEEGHFSEEDAALLIRDILEGIRYIHDELNIVHRDLKPENFLLSDDTDDADIKIIDFGLSRRNNADFGIMNSRVGTY
jgi:calcium-dependent protein kinase